VTYRELADSAGDLALVLAAGGVGHGDRFVWLGGASRPAVDLAPRKSVQRSHPSLLAPPLASWPRKRVGFAHAS
jgi:hypothetical protein